ncbi:MAG: hypothetical protein ACLP52_04845 [Streptosporangiaceae bacterium]
MTTVAELADVLFGRAPVDCGHPDKTREFAGWPHLAGCCDACLQHLARDLAASRDRQLEAAS